MAQSRWRLNLDQVLVSNVPNGANGAMDLVMRTDQATDYIFAAVGSFARAHIFRNTDAGGSGTWQDVFSEVNQGRTSLAIAPSNQNIIYALATCIACGAGTNPNFPISYTDGLLGVFGPHLQAMPAHGPHRRATTALPCKTRYFSVILSTAR